MAAGCRFSKLTIGLSILLALILGGDHQRAEAFSVKTGTTSVNKIETTVNELLSQAPDYSPSSDDDFFRNFRQNVPCQIQYFLRDSGVARFLVDTTTWFTAPPAILEMYPTALMRFLHVSGLKGSLLSKLVGQQLKTDPSDDEDLDTDVKFQRLKYGDHRKQIIDMIQCKTKSKERNDSKQLVLFVHGGAWGSGFPALYRLMAGPFLKQNFDVAFLGYRTYPDGDVPDQSEDIISSVWKLEQEGLIDSETHVTLMGHSSGSHIAAMAVLSSQAFRQRIGSFVVMNGVYDVPKHYLHERTRGVERLSPMAVASISPGAKLSFDRSERSLREEWKSQSPTWLLQQPELFSYSLTDCFPDTLIVHGQNDVTVPMESSIRLWESLQVASASSSQENTCRIDLAILPEVDHVEVITQIMFGGITRDTVLNWMLEGE